MTAVQIPSSLVPIARTNADWSMDINFSGEDWTDSQVSVIFARQGAAHAFEATIGDGVWTPTTQLSVALRVPAATWAEVPPATYSVQVRRLRDGEIDDAAVFMLTVQKGLSGLLTAPASAPALSGAGDKVGSVIVSRVGAVEVVRGGGVQGDKGDKGDNAEAVQIAFDDTLTNLGATNAQEAFLVLADLAQAGGLGELDFSNPYNLPLIGAF